MTMKKSKNASKSKYRFIHLNAEGEILVEPTANALEQAYPVAYQHSTTYPEMVKIACAAARMTKVVKDAPLFTLARTIKGQLPFGARNFAFTWFYPMAVLFAEIMDLWYQAPVYFFDPLEAPELGDDMLLEILFERAWQATRYALDENGNSECLLEVAINFSKDFSERAYPGVHNSYNRLILGIAQYFYEFSRDPFLLPQERLAELLDIPQSTISAIIKGLCRARVLKIEKKAVHLKGKAQQYSFHPDQLRYIAKFSR
jgi:hypothetical protein